MKKIGAFAFVCFLMLFFCVSSARAQQASREDVVVLVQSAVQLIEQEGEEKAFDAFNKGGIWKDRDLYIVVIGQDGVCLANANVPAMVGKILLDLKDVDGKYFIHDILEIQDAGWVDYKWPNPMLKKMGSKRSYVIHVGEYFVFAGAYL